MVVPDREPMTLTEARRVGAAANRLGLLRDALRDAVAGTLTVKTERSSTQSIPLYSLDTEAMLSLLIEREEQFLVSMGVGIREAY